MRQLVFVNRVVRLIMEPLGDRATVEQWIKVYSEQGTNSAIGHLVPLEFKRQRRLQEPLLLVGMG